MAKKLINKLGTEKAEIYIYNDIDSFFGFSAADLKNELVDLSSNAELIVHINSIGGDVFEGLAIYNLLKMHKGKVVTVVEGIAASIASIIFLAGDERHMLENSMLMVHNPMVGSGGNSKDLEQKLELLKKSEEQVVGIYMAHTNLDEQGIRSLLDAETFLTPEEAMQMAFATEIINTPSVTATAKDVVRSLVAKLFRSKDMNFEQWLANYCKPLGLDSSKLTDQQRTDLKAKYEAENKTAPTPPPVQATAVETPSASLSQNSLERQRQAAADEEDRVSGIRDIAARRQNDRLNEDYLKDLGVAAKTVRGLVGHAIREGWSQDKFELECRRAEMPSMGHVGIHRATPEREIYDNGRAVSAALVRQAGITARAKNSYGEEYGYEVQYKQEDLEASDHPALRNAGLLQLLEQYHIKAFGRRYDGRLNTDGFINATREAMWKLRMDATNTTWGGLNIFDDAANKMLWSAYNSVPTTWREWVATMSVSDFKTHNFYRLTNEGSYLKLGADGRLKHGGFGDDKYTAQADTYGKIVGLARRDIINDDLGALSGVMTALGIEGARFLEELFYGHLLAQLTTLFPSAGTYNNYQDGAATDLGIDGISTAEQLFRDQVDSDGAPILMNADILLVGTQDAVVARELYVETNLQGLQTANAKKRPDQNPHVGKYRPVVTPYLNNTNLLQRTDAQGAIGQAFSNQSSDQWLLLPNPSLASGAIVIGSFLNGVQTPTIESADASFDQLGMQWRAYHDAGADNGDPKMGVYSKGAA